MWVRLTCAIIGENGMALSLANDHICLDTVATVDLFTRQPTRHKTG